MIEKVARSTALRRAYPEQFGGIYESAEMGDKGHDINAPAVEAQPVIPSRAAEAKRLEAPPPPAPPAAEGLVVEADPQSAHAAWDAVYRRLDEARADTAGKDWSDAVKTVVGKWVPGRNLTPEQLAAVERILFPDANP
jgi:hypothetical protein